MTHLCDFAGLEEEADAGTLGLDGGGAVLSPETRGETREVQRIARTSLDSTIPPLPSSSTGGERVCTR